MDEAGAYDGMTAYDLSELLLYKAMATGQATEAQALTFLDRLYPGQGTQIFGDRVARLGNIEVIRPTTAFRRPPGSTPWISGPPSDADLAA